MCFHISVRSPSTHSPRHAATTLAVGAQRCGGGDRSRSRGSGQGLQAQCWPAPSGQTSIPCCHSGLPASAKAPAQQGPSPLPTQTPKAPVPRGWTHCSERPPTRQVLGMSGDREAVIWACSPQHGQSGVRQACPPCRTPHPSSTQVLSLTHWSPATSRPCLHEPMVRLGLPLPTITASQHAPASHRSPNPPHGHRGLQPASATSPSPSLIKPPPCHFAHAVPSA